MNNREWLMSKLSELSNKQVAGAFACSLCDYIEKLSGEVLSCNGVNCKDCLTVWFQREHQEPDSWEKLQEDIKRATDVSEGSICQYAGINVDCNDCAFHNKGKSCATLAFTDINNRITKLRGEN